MIRQSVRVFSASALLSLSLSAFSANAQQNVPAAPPQEPASQAPAAPAPAAAPVFPKVDPANFTAASPTKDTVNAFMQASWGYDDSRVWQVQGILKTAVEGVSKVVIYAGDKTGKQKLTGISFFVLPDGKHIIAGDEIIPFGDHPFAEPRKILQDRADGPFQGAASKDLELVEFADFQCPHCKDAQANMEKLLADFPKARIVFQNYPLATLHKQAVSAASYGICVAKAGGSTAFFQYASAVFDGQDGLSSDDGAALTLNSAVTKSGQDPAKIAECAKTPAVGASVEASVKLALELNVNQTPTLMVNGRPVPANAPYDTLKQIILFQEKLDGIGQ